MINLNKIKNVLFMFCHPDDETLGAGGTINKFKRSGKNIFLALSGMGIQSRHKLVTKQRDFKLNSQKNEAIIVATRPNPKNKISVFSSEILSSTGYLKPSKFEPNLFIELSKKDIQAKIKAMNCYTTEKRKYPHPRSPEAIKALSMLRGAYSGNKYAEGFLVENLFIKLQ